MANQSSPAPVHRPSYRSAAVAGAAVFALYLITLAPTTAMWDTSEYITAAYRLGIPHPPGNPLFVLMGRVVTLLPIARGVAARINVFAAFASAVAAAMWFLITERILAGWFSERWRRIAGASIATLLGATEFTVWNQSVANEHTYTITLAGLAIVSWLMVRWCDESDAAKADRLLVLVAYLLGLGYSNHMAGFLAGPAVAVAVLMRRPRTILRWKLLLASALALGFGITPFATQPIRAAFRPPVNEGSPTACTNGLHVACTFSKGTYDAFKYNFNREQFGKPDLSIRQAPFTAQLGMWWWYFKWQWVRDAMGDAQLAQKLLAALFLMLGLAGGWAHHRRDRQSFWYFATLMFTMTLALIYYLNFKYGASQSPELGLRFDEREVRDRDYFFLWSYSAWGVWAGLGLLYVWELLASLVGVEKTKLAGGAFERPSRLGERLASPVLLLAFVPLMANWSWASRAGTTDARDFAADLLNSVEPYGVLVVGGDNDTFPLWYAQHVEGIRDDVTVAQTSLLSTSWYVEQLIRAPIREYDAARGPAIYRNGTWPRPTAPALNMTVAQADSVTEVFAVPAPLPVQLGPITATIDPARLTLKDGNGVGYLTRGDVFVLRMIADSYGKRPIYLSNSSGGYAAELGLANNVISQGLASKVFIPPGAPTRDTLLMPGIGWLDVPRTRALWDSVFVGTKSMATRRRWVDQPSAGIPYIYVATAVGLSEALRVTGALDESRTVMSTAKRIVDNLRLDRYFPRISEAVSPGRPVAPPGGDSKVAKPLAPPPQPPPGAKGLPPARPAEPPRGGFAPGV
jgi:hypothetical protein